MPLHALARHALAVYAALPMLVPLAAASLGPWIAVIVRGRLIAYV